MADGPFFEEGGMIFRVTYGGELAFGERRQSRIPMALPYETLSDEMVAELVDLLNKGTHAAALAAALRKLIDGESWLNAADATDAHNALAAYEGKQ